MDKFLTTEYRYEGTSETDKHNREIAVFDIDTLLDKTVASDSLKDFAKNNDFAFYGSGWQSWGFGGETDTGKYQKKYFPLIPQWVNYITVPGTKPKVLGKKANDKKLLKGCFIIYLRWNNLYLVIASTGNTDNDMPPVEYFVDRASRKICCTIYSQGKQWKNGELMARLSVFACVDYFDLKQKIKELYAPDFDKRFSTLKFLSSKNDCIYIGGWESWYNHYSDINTKLISDDLEGLGNSENLIRTFFVDEHKPCVFQVDDGWEKDVGDWINNDSRFPEGMTALADKIEGKGYVPGLWIAPFIIDWRCDFAKKHRDWILRDSKGKPVQAGFNLLWGAKLPGKDQPGLPFSYYCLDLSRDDVLDYIDSLMDTVINKWGFRYIKLDFLFAGMLYGAYKNGGAAYQWYSKALQILTKRTVNSKGKNVAYLGCGMPFENSFRYLPLSRIGPDTKEDWDVDYLKKVNFTARPGAFANMQSTLGHAFWNQSVYINDPDVVFLRYTNISLSDKEKMLIALVNFLFASQTMHSDDPVKFDYESEGYFTATVQTLYERFDGVEFALVNNDSESYFIYSKGGRYSGFINLSDTEKVIKIKDMIFSDQSERFNRVIEFGRRTGDSYIFESHSLSVYSVV